MNQGDDFMELLELQDNLDMITKTELLERTRERGAPISDRQLTALVSEGLIPQSARIGSRGGAYPALVAEQLWFVKKYRSRGLSVKAVKELLPLWRYMKRAIRDHEISLPEFQYIARENVTMTEGWYAVPSVLQETLPCMKCEKDEWQTLTFRLKDGSELQAVGDQTVTIGFAMAKQDPETGKVHIASRMRLAVPRDDEGYNDDSVILGIPNGVELPAHDHHEPEKVSVTNGPVSDDRIGSEKGAAA